MKAFTIVKLLACALFLIAGGCSVRHIPLDQSVADQDPVIEYAAEYDGGSYYSGSSISSPRFAADAWRMSQYYRGGIPSNQSSTIFGYQPSDRLNIDPNPYDNYRSGEAPIMRAPAQDSAQLKRNVTETRKRTRSPQTSDWRRDRFVDQAGSNERQVRRSLKQRRQVENIDDDDGSSKEKSRQKTRKRTRRRK